MTIFALQGNRTLTYEILAKGETVDGNSFKRFLTRKMRPALIRARILHPIILMDNARPHYHQVIRDNMDRRGWEILDHSPYSPDMNPCEKSMRMMLSEKLRALLRRHVSILRRDLQQQLRLESMT
jgi:transposase